MKHLRAQSEVIGVILLTGIVVIFASLVGFFVLSNFDTDSDPAADFVVTAESKTLEIAHDGGDALGADDTVVVLNENTRIPLGDFTETQGNANGRFDAGEIREHSHSEDGSIGVVIVHEPSNSVVYRDTISITVTIEAEFTYTPSSPTSTQLISFDGSDSSVAGSSIASWEWDFDDDGTTDATGETAPYTFGDDGSYPVTLTVTADDGRTANRTRTVTVQNESPAPSFTYSPSTPDTGEQITFDGSGSSDADGSVQSYEWDFGDGTTGSGETASHSYSDYGTYSVELTVTDDDGSSNSTVQTVTVAPEYFDVSIQSTNSPVTEGDTLSVDANVTNTGNSQGTQDITLDINGTEEDRQSVTLASGASTTVTLNWPTTVGDEQANPYVAKVSSENTSDTVQIDVNDGGGGPDNPSVDSLSASATGGSGKIQIDASFSDPSGDGNTLDRVDIEVRDSGGSIQYTDTVQLSGDSDTLVNHQTSKLDDGTYTVELEVKDTAGNSGTGQTTEEISSPGKGGN